MTKFKASALALATVALGAMHLQATAGTYPVVATYDGTGSPNVSVWLGAPDDSYLGLGASNVTYDFGLLQVVNRSGLVDLNVYEVDSGGPEFNLMTVLVSQDGVTFTSIKSSETALVRTSGDTTHGNNSFGRSYDLGSLPWVRYVRIDGLGNGGASGATAFDLDAIGAHEVLAVPEPATWALWLAGLAAVGRVAQQRASRAA
jgi:hypothetical protein